MLDRTLRTSPAAKLNGRIYFWLDNSLANPANLTSSTTTQPFPDRNSREAAILAIILATIPFATMIPRIKDRAYIVKKSDVMTLPHRHRRDMIIAGPIAPTTVAPATAAMLSADSKPHAIGLPRKSLAGKTGPVTLHQPGMTLPHPANIAPANTPLVF